MTTRRWLAAAPVTVCTVPLGQVITRSAVALIAWGPYLWADGLTPRSDALVWTCQDLNPDGTHPSSAGRQKVAHMPLEFFKTDVSARRWFLAGQ